MFKLSGVDFVPCKLVTADEFKSCVIVAVVDFDDVLVFVAASLWIARVHILNNARGVDRLVVGRASPCSAGSGIAR